MKESKEKKTDAVNKRKKNNSRNTNTLAFGMLATSALVVGIFLANEQSQNGSSPQPPGPRQARATSKQPVINPFDLPETIQLLGDIDERKNELRMANLSFKSQDINTF